MSSRAGHGDEETALADDAGKPTMITRFPAAIKAFYMEPDPNDPARAAPRT